MGQNALGKNYGESGMGLGPQTQRLAYDLQYLFLKTMILEAGWGPVSKFSLAGLLAGE